MFNDFILCRSVWYSIHFPKLMVSLVIFPFVAVVLLMSTNLMNVFSPFSCFSKYTDNTHISMKTYRYFSKYTHNTHISMKTYRERDLILTIERHLQKIKLFWTVGPGQQFCREIFWICIISKIYIVRYQKNKLTKQ